MVESLREKSEGALLQLQCIFIRMKVIVWAKLSGFEPRRHLIKMHNS